MRILQKKKNLQFNFTLYKSYTHFFLIQYFVLYLNLNGKTSKTIKENVNS